jgi:hypothetical protein
MRYRNYQAVTASWYGRLFAPMSRIMCRDNLSLREGHVAFRAHCDYQVFPKMFLLVNGADSMAVTLTQGLDLRDRTSIPPLDPASVDINITAVSRV